MKKDESPCQSSYIAINTKKGRDYPGFQSLSDKTHYVHINGILYLWALLKILELAPNVKRIRIIPSQHIKLGNVVQSLCRDNHIEITAGCQHPEYSSKHHHPRNKRYFEHQAFLKGLAGKQKKLFDELIRFKIKAALMTARYFCLNGEDFVPQRLIAKQFGFKERRQDFISMKIIAILYYLDPSIEAGKMSKRYAGIIKRAVKKQRQAIEDKRQRQETQRLTQDRLNPFGLDELPAGLPKRLYELFFRLLKARQVGRLSALKDQDFRAHRVICLRFDLEQPQPRIFRTLKETAHAMGYRKRQNVHPYEERALQFLGIRR